MSLRIPLSLCVVLSLSPDTLISDEKRRNRGLPSKPAREKRPFGMCDKTKAEGAAGAGGAIMLAVAHGISVGHMIESANEALAEGALDSCT